jgi:hypothetical protein
MNDLKKYADTLAAIRPWAGKVPPGFTVDFLGTLTSKEFLTWGYHPAYVDGAELSLQAPSLGDKENGEFWFEAVDWVLAAREARDQFVMVTLGALFGYQVVGGYRALQLVNPLPYKLVAIEPIPENVQWTRRHMRDNGVDPDEQWVIQAVMSDTNEPVFFPVGSPGLGAQNCISTNEAAERRRYFERVVEAGQATETLESLLVSNSTGLQKDIIAGHGSFGEIRLVSAITLRDLLTPLDRVDLLEADIQESEKIVFPPHRQLLKQKVRRVHLGTHGVPVHEMLHQMFADDGWEIVFSFAPERVHETELGAFTTNDGILSAVNPTV